jgi:hypothetical protein
VKQRPFEWLVIYGCGAALLLFVIATLYFMAVFLRAGWIGD